MRKNNVHTRRKRGRLCNPVKPALLTLAIAQALAFQAVQAASIEVTSNLDDGTDCTLREAIETVNAGTDQLNGCIITGDALGTADAISFGTGVAGSTIVTNGELTITQSVSINSGGVPTTIDANGVGSVIGVGGNFVAVELDQLTLTGGNAIGDGGGIFADSSYVTLTNSTVSGNSASWGGGIAAGYSEVTLTNSTVSGNSASYGGGGIYAVIYSPVTLSNSTVSGNSASWGGGIFARRGSPVRLTNSTVSGNTGDGIHATFDTFVRLSNSTVSGNTGGGIDVSDYTSVRLSNSTVSGNTGVGIHADYSSYATLNNSIVANSLGADCAADTFVYVNADSIIEDGSCGTAAMAVDPLLGPLADNGGPTQTHALLPGSPAINRGDPNFTPPPDFDQRGPGFPRVAGGRVDIGAFESGSQPSAVAMLAALGDINGDGSEDIAVLIHDAMANTVTATIKDAEDGSFIQQVSFNGNRVPVALKVMADIDNNGAPELVVLGQGQGTVKAQIRDSFSGAFQNTVAFNPDNPPVDLEIVPDQDGNGIPELAVLGESPAQVEVRDALNGNLLKKMKYTDNMIPKDLVVLPDINGNGGPEMGVLGEHDNPGKSDRVEIRDLFSGRWVRNLYYGKLNVRQAQVVPDLNNNTAPEVAVLRTTDGKVNVLLRDATGNSLVRSFGFDPNHAPGKLLVVPDVNGNSASEIAVFGKNPNNRTQKAQVKDAKTKQRIRNVFFDKTIDPADLVVMPDMNGNGASEIAFLGTRATGDLTRVIIKDSKTGALVGKVDF